MKTLVIQNPYSNRWTSLKRHDEVIKALDDSGLDYKIVCTEKPREATELARKAVGEGFETIVAAGGDGTIGEVITGIVLGAGEDGPFPKFGVLPLGSANDLMANLGLPIELNEAVKVIASGKTRQIDLCKADEIYFLNNAGLGLEPFVTTVQEKIKRVQGDLRYLLATLISIMRNPKWTMKLEWDDGAYEGKVTLVSIGNGARTGGVFYTVPNADPFDGKLSFVYGYLPTRLKILQLLPRTMKPGEGNYVEHPAVNEVNSTWLKVQIQPGTPAHADGEIYSHSTYQAEYKVFPAKIPILMGE